MVTASKTYDVFISHGIGDAALALDIAHACRLNGLEAVTNSDLSPGIHVADALWDALAESQALLAIVSPSGPTISMGIEIGAARAWNKPIFAVVTDSSMTRLPAALAGVRLYPSGRIDDVIEAIRRTSQPLSEEDRTVLARAYSDTGVSVDQLALDPTHLTEIVKRFNQETGKSLAGERLLAELLRMRKQGKLTKSSSLGRSKPNRRTT